MRQVSFCHWKKYEAKILDECDLGEASRLRARDRFYGRLKQHANKLLKLADASFELVNACEKDSAPAPWGFEQMRDVLYPQPEDS